MESAVKGVLATILTIVCVSFLSGCPATSGTTGGGTQIQPIQIDPARCAAAQDRFTKASADVAKLKEAGIMSGDDYELAVIAQLAAQMALDMACSSQTTVIQPAQTSPLPK